MRIQGLALACVVALHAVVYCADAPRPNIIFIISDDHRWDALGVVQREQGQAARFPWFKTPALDRIAAGGARFRNAFVVQSLCSPSRAAFLTGQYSHRHGVKDNSTELRADIPNWAKLLRDTGYATGYFGKWHMKRQAERPGFDTVYTYLGQGVYFNSSVLDNDRATTVSDWIDDAITTKAIEFIRNRREQPFAMMIGYKSPHDPRTPPARRKSDFAEVTIEPPISYRDLPPFMAGVGMQPVDAQKRQPDWRNYFRCVAAMDDDIGALLDTLDELKIAENTMVIYVGDNGFFLGEHGLDDKRNAQEESMRIPLLVRYPKMVKPGTLVDAVTLNIDLAPTLLEVGGVAPGPTMQGRCWLPLLQGQTPTDWRTTFYYESYKDPAYPRITVDLEAVRSPDTKLIQYPGHEEWTELYQLARDPYERTNLARNVNQHDYLTTASTLLEAEKQKVR
jgi:arylsulfatase A-like enzyme